MDDHDELSFEREYWGNCCNTFDEDQKHYVYARYMGLQRSHYSFELNALSVLDIGGGPSSMLLKCKGLQRGLVIDPIKYPSWTTQRYQMHNVDVRVMPGELVDDERGWDEVWIYNCLQHVHDASKIIENARKSAPTLRIFEWIDIPPHEGHPVHLTKEYLDTCIHQHFQGESGTVRLAESGCYGHAYYGVFTA